MGRKISKQDGEVTSREDLTGDQIHILLGVAGMLHSVLAGAASEGSAPAVDGGARLAAEVTFNNVCSRLDAIVNDASRWDTTGHDAMQQGVLSLQRQSLQLLRAQTAATEEINTPHFRLKPTLFRLQNGGWAAIVGKHIDHALVGTGATPEEAIVAFDLIFKGQMAANTVAWLTEREAQIEAGIPLNDSNIQHEKQNNVDGSGNGHTDGPAGAREDSSGDLKSPRKKRKSRGSKT